MRIQLSICGLSICIGTVTLTPGGTVSLDCGSTQTFTCRADRAASTAVWTVTGLSGIIAMRTSGVKAASSNNRITTTDPSENIQVSTIIISGFTTADEGGTVQCIESTFSLFLGSSVATIHIESGGNYIEEGFKYNQCYL